MGELKLKDLSCTMASTQQLVLILALQAVSASCSSMCDTCTSFLESADRLMMPTVRDALVQPKGDCQKACLKMQTGKDMISCAVLCEHTGTDTFASLLEISDYVDATEMCSSHQVCARKEVPDSAIALLETAAMTGQNASKAKPGNVTINGDMTITGALKTKSIRASALTVNGSITVTHAVRTEFLKADNKGVCRGDLYCFIPNRLSAADRQPRPGQNSRRRWRCSAGRVHPNGGSHPTRSEAVATAAPRQLRGC